MSAVDLAASCRYDGGMLTAKPVLKTHLKLSPPNAGQRFTIPYRRTHKPKFSDRKGIRQRYKKPSIRQRAMGSREKTSVKLERIYEWEDPFAINDPSLHWEDIGKVKTAKTRPAIEPMISTFAYDDLTPQQVRNMEIEGIEYYRNMTEFLARYPRYIGKIGKPMDHQVLVDRRMVVRTINQQPVKLDNMVIIDGMPILLKD